MDVRARAQVSDGREALSFDWRDAMPELHPVYEQVSLVFSSLVQSVVP